MKVAEKDPSLDPLSHSASGLVFYVTSVFPISSLVFLWFILHLVLKVIFLKYRAFPSIYLPQATNVSWPFTFIQPQWKGRHFSLTSVPCLLIPAFASLQHDTSVSLAFAYHLIAILSAFTGSNVFTQAALFYPEPLVSRVTFTLLLGFSLGNSHSHPEASAYHSPKLDSSLRSPSLPFPEFPCVSQLPN